MENTLKKNKVSNKIKATCSRPRFCVFRSNAEIYAQIIAADGKVIASASSLKINEKDKTAAAKVVGETVAKNAIKNKITEVVFDRRGFRYHGRVAALADGARGAGLKF